MGTEMTNTTTLRPPTATGHASILPKASADASRVKASRPALLRALDSPAGLRLDSDAPGCKTLPMGESKPRAALDDERTYARVFMHELSRLGYTVTARGNRITARRRTKGDPK